MDETLRQVDIGVSTADAHALQIAYVGANLVVRYVDWTEQDREMTFHGVLGFRWQIFNDDAPRDDTSYEVINSKWLGSQATLADEPVDQYRHFRICFNQNGVLDVLFLPV